MTAGRSNFQGFDCYGDRILRSTVRKLVVFGLVSICLVGRAAGAETAWLTGDELQAELQRSLGITWSGSPLRQALAGLLADRRVAIWIDRRIDPGRTLELSLEETPLRLLLRRAARLVEAEIGYVGPVVYLGPSSTAEKLWTIAELRNEETRRLPPEIRTRWTTRRPAEWAELSTPRELLAAIAQEGGCQIEGLEAIPHDLWPAASLPALTLAERLTLVLAGFEQTFEFAENGKTVRLTQFPDRFVLQREYSLPRDAARLATELTDAFPAAKFNRAGTKLSVAGTAEDHDAIRRLLRGETVQRSADKPRSTPTKSAATKSAPSKSVPSKSVPAKEPDTRYTITVKNQPVGAVLRTLEVKAQLQLSIDPDVQSKLGELVSFELKEASLEQLLRATVQGTGLDYQINGRKLRITLAN